MNAKYCKKLRKVAKLMTQESKITAVYRIVRIGKRPGYTVLLDKCSKKIYKQLKGKTCISNWGRVK